jgi:MFS family permease
MALPSQPVSGWRFLLRALRHRNYRLFFIGESLSFTGTWMTRIVTGWLVYRLTGSALALGWIAFLGQIPSFVLTPFTGVWIDRWSRHRTLIWINTVSMLLSLAFAALAFSHHIAIWQVGVLALLQGIVNAMDTPARQTFLLEMLEERADLPNAVALNAGLLTVARMLGPLLAGVIIAVLGEAWCFTIDGISYGAVIVALLLMQIAACAPRRRAEENLWRELRDGFRYVSGSVPIRTLLILLAFVSLVGMPYLALLPIFARKILHGGPQTLGMLMSSTGAGALVAVVAMAANRGVHGLQRNIGLGALFFGSAMFVFALSRSLALSLAMLFIAGFAMMQLSATVNTILQMISESAKRGRVMGYFTMAFMGMMPFGSLLGGAIASHFGAPRALVFSGILCAVSAAVYFAFVPAIGRALRSLYGQLGLLAQSSLELEAAMPVSSETTSQ